MGGKHRGWTEIKRISQRLRRSGKRIVFTNGCFDLLHPGHIRTLTHARRLGDALIIGLNSDRSVRRLKGKMRPLINQRGRVAMLTALTCVNYVVVFDGDTPERLIRTLRPHVLVKGADWSKHVVSGETFVKSYGGRVRKLPLVKGQSTSRLFKLLKG